MNPVFIWWPNIVGYCRILTMIGAMYFAMESPVPSLFLYATSQLLDAVDGTVARYFGQCSKFGALLDMLTDRMSTTCLLIVISIKQPQDWSFYTSIIVLDLVAHWAQMYATLALGGQSHKENTNPILKFYYSFPFLLLFCLGNEAYIITSYMSLFVASKSSPLPALLSAANLATISRVCLPVFIGKNFFNIVQLYESSWRLAREDNPLLASRRKMQ